MKNSLEKELTIESVNISDVPSQTEMTVVCLRCAWVVVRCCVHRVTAVRQSSGGAQWERRRLMHTAAEPVQECSSGKRNITQSATDIQQPTFIDNIRHHIIFIAHLSATAN